MRKVIALAFAAFAMVAFGTFEKPLALVKGVERVVPSDTFKAYWDDTLVDADCGSCTALPNNFFANKAALRTCKANSLTSIGSFVYRGSGLERFESSSLGKMGEHALRETGNLLECYTPNVSNTLTYCYYGCTKMTNLVVGVLSSVYANMFMTCFKANTDVYCRTSNTCSDLMGIAGFPFGLENTRRNGMHFVCTDGQIRYIDGAWTIITE